MPRPVNLRQHSTFAAKGLYSPSIEEVIVGWRRTIRAVLVGAITFILALIYVPQCGVQVYVENANTLSFGIAAVTTYIAYRFR